MKILLSLSDDLRAYKVTSKVNITLSYTIIQVSFPSTCKTPHSKKYSEPLLVRTRFPLTNLPLIMGEVVTNTPSLNEFDPYMNPSMALSLSTFHCF